jgi:hypothetical protein
MAHDPNLTKTSYKEGKYVTWIRWDYKGVLTAQEAAQKQTDAGYNPMGYGFYRFVVKDGTTSWSCSNSCD